MKKIGLAAAAGRGTREILVLRPTQPAAPVLWDPRTNGQPSRPTVLSHFVESMKKRLRMRIDTKTARTAIPALRTMAEQARLATEYQTAVNALSLAELEREVRLGELEQRKAELGALRRQSAQLEEMRLKKERLALELEIASVQRQIKEQKRRNEQKLTPDQQKRLKKTEFEDQLQRLRAEEARALKQADTEPEKRRLQNMYANRRERLMEQLEKFL